MSEGAAQRFEVVRFRPLMDWWVALGVGIALVALLVAIPRLFMVGGGFQVYTVVAIAAIAAMVLYLVDIAFYSFYVLADDELLIVNHLRVVHIPYRSMTALQPGGFLALFSFGSRKRFALSRKNVIIKLSHGMWRSISVSPVRQEDFVRKLLERIDAERSHRAARLRKQKKK